MNKPISIPTLLLLLVVLSTNASSQGRIAWQATDASSADRQMEGTTRVYANTGQPANGVSSGSGRIVNSGYLFVRLMPSGAANIVAQSNIDFGSVIVGQNETRSLTVQNTGAAPLNISATNISPAAFTITSGGGAQIIAPGGSASMQLRFNPSAAGAANGTLTIASNAANDPSFDVVLTGTGTASAPNLQLSASILDFGALTIGSTSTRSVTLSNTGNAPLTISGQSLSGPDASLFQIIHNAVSPIGASGSDYIEIRYAPASAGNHTAQLTIQSNDPNVPSAIVTLSGSATSSSVPRIAVNTTLLDFGTTPPSTPVSRVVVISNTGSAPLTLLAQNANGAGFSVQTAAASPIAPGGTATATLVFQASAAGTYNGDFIIGSNDPSTPSLTVTLRGVCGTVSGPRITTNRSIVDFGQVGVLVPKEEDLIIRNIGSGDLILSQQSIQGTDALHFSISQAAASPIAAAGSSTVRVRLLATTIGSKVAILHIESNDPAQPVTEVVLISSVVGTDAPSFMPNSVRLQQNYPNPFNPGTTFSFETQAAGVVELHTYSVNGEDVGIINREFREAGTHAVYYDASRLPSGVYTVECRLIRGDVVERSNSIRMVLMK